MLLSSGDNFPHLFQKRRSQLGFVTYLLNYPRTFKVQGSVHRKYSFDIFPTRRNITQFVSGKLLYMFRMVSPSTIRSTELYLQYLVLFKALLLPAAIVDELGLV